MILRYGNPAEVGMCPERIKYTENMVSDWVSRGDIQAAGMLIARRGVIVSHKAFGKQCPEPDSQQLQLDTLFPVASITKSIVATCIMRLVEMGLLDLAHPVKRYVSEFIGEGKESVAIHHLMTHTSGMNDEVIGEHANKNYKTATIPKPDVNQHPGIHERLFLGYDAPLWRKPGVSMRYCNYGYELLGDIVRRVSGFSLSDFASAQIFKPLGMKNTFLIVPDEYHNNVVRRQPPEGCDIDWSSTPANLKRPSAAGGLCTTTYDLAIFGQMFLNRGNYGNTRILSPITVDTMTRNHIPGVSAEYEDQVFKSACWGLGWNVRETKMDDSGNLRSPQSYDHGGWGGVRFLMDPEYEFLWVYLSVEGKFTKDLFSNAAMAAIIE